MKMTVKSEYALLALVYLAQQNPVEYISAKNISSNKDIPIKYLEQLLMAMKNAGYIVSTKGKQGGYRLAKAPKKINIAEILRLFDGALAPTDSVSKYFYRATPIRNEKKLMHLFKSIRDFISDRLENTSLADIS